MTSRDDDKEISFETYKHLGTCTRLSYSWSCLPLTPGSPRPADSPPGRSATCCLCCTREHVCHARQQPLTRSCLSSADLPSCVTAGRPDVPSSRDRKQRCCPVSDGASGRPPRGRRGGSGPQGLALTCREASCSASSCGCGGGRHPLGRFQNARTMRIFFNLASFRGNQGSQSLIAFNSSTYQRSFSLEQLVSLEKKLQKLHFRCC